jgi:hypothetical protein
MAAYSFFVSPDQRLGLPERSCALSMQYVHCVGDRSRFPRINGALFLITCTRGSSTGSVSVRLECFVEYSVVCSWLTRSIMSAKILPLLQLESAVVTRHNSFESAADVASSTKTKSPPLRLQRQISRGTSNTLLTPREGVKDEGNLAEDSTPPTRKQLSRQNSLQHGKVHRPTTLSENEDFQDNSFNMEKSEINTARLQSSIKGALSARRMNSSSNLSSKSSRKRVMFNVPLVDPTPERAPCANSAVDSDYTLGPDDFSTSSSRRRVKSQNNRFQAQSPLRQFARSVTLAYRALVRFTDRLF